MEKSDDLGGQARFLYRTIEGVLVQEYLEDLIGRVRAHPLVKVHTGTEVLETGGRPGDFSVTLRRGSEEWTEGFGAAVIATGGIEYEPVEYLYGQDPRVLTQRELEALLVREDEKVRAARQVVMIQCVGSRTEDNPSCSRVCCTAAVKNALWLKEANPEAQVMVLYRDMRTFGLKEYYYQEAREAGVLFMRYVPEDPPRVEAGDDSVMVRLKDTALGEWIELSPDLLVLSAGIRPDPDTAAVSSLFKLAQTTEGFFLEAHVKLRPLDFSASGFFLAGLAHGPKFLDESIAQAKAAASRASVILSKPVLKVEGLVSHVDELICRGCGECEAVCPFGAISVVEREGNVKKAFVQEALCKGCGACSVACPTGAASIFNYNDQLVLDMVEAAFAR